jgi:hypothetical protein
MISLTNIAQTNVATQYPLDKIVGIYEGSFNAGTQTTITTYTLFGLPYKVWYYQIPHSFTRPVFCDVSTSTDGTSYDNSRIAISDSSKIYIYAGQGSAPSGTIYYRLTATWIDNYDNTNPSISLVNQGAGALYFNSTANYQKIKTQDVVSLANNTNTSVAHNLGYYPNCKVFMESVSGQVWPCHTGGAQDIFSVADSENSGYFSITTTALNIFCDQNASSFGASRFWYRIYLDA